MKWFAKIDLNSVSVLVFRLTNRMSMALGFLKVGPGAGPQLTCTNIFKNTSGHSSKEGRQAINLTPSKRIKAWGTASWGQRDLQRRGTPDRKRAVDTTAGRSATQQLERRTKHKGLVRYLSRAPPNKRVWHKAVFKVDLVAEP